MNLLFLLCVLCLTFTGLCEGAGVLVDDLLNAPVGGKVLFTTKLTPQEPHVTVQIVIWNFGTLNIITFTGSNITTPGYEDRITLFISSGSLELRKLSLDDSGDYSVSIISSGGESQTGSTTLRIYEPISNVMITTSSPDLVEFISSVHLSCSSSGSSPSFHWLNGSSEVTASDRVQITDGGSNLTIFNVTRYDQGTFRCRVVNPVSNGTSDPVFLSVSYGPGRVQITGPREIDVKHTLTLTCSAESTPSASYTWFLNTTEILSDSAVFTKEVTEFSDGGSYTCTATNNVTGRRSTAVHALSVIVKQPPSCNSGCIAGITIACCVVVGLCASGLYFVCRRRKQPINLSHGDTRTGGGIQNSVASSSNQKQDGKPVQLE
ncbi:carcinoembryonic antigen-related cell adhesion molecule 5-like isoform X2 [Limanda limanda]|uniref:carcinoembryonic antigen-related cell adhesion molecule 5-like isoform X2 n=1 Tax=Limanda limanda TaxID=27771 RepID=UPI0029C95C89|nr:carcinoembryonic antigen-related cell adhesion molecule 5-like isoform X2 [Limanda limanda]